MLRKFSRLNRRRTLTIGAWSLTIIVAAAASATAGSMITGKQIQNGSITGADIQNGSLGYGELSAGARTRLVNRAAYKAKKMTPPGSANSEAPGAAGAKGAAGEPGAPGKDGKDGVAATLGANFTAPYKNMGLLGGPFAQNKTTMGQFELAPGTYVVNGAAFFDRIDDNASSTPILQLALRGDTNPPTDMWGADYGTGFTGNYPATGNREQTTTTSQVVTVGVPTTIHVHVFGYNNGANGDGSNNYRAKVSVNAIKVA